MIDYSVVIPTTGRESLRTLLEALDGASGPAPREIVVVDDRPSPHELPLPPCRHRIEVVFSGGRGPAAARNSGWRRARGDWIAFLDDDVVVGRDWPDRLAEDLAGLGPETAASQGRIVVPLPVDRRPTDDERGTAGLATARWITADMAYRRSVLSAVGGFDERFPRAYREDADLALRVCLAGYVIASGARTTTHPVRDSGPLASLRAQRGNADNALMRRKYGRHWRARIGEGPGRIRRHLACAAAGGLTVLFRLCHNRKAAAVTATVWAALTAEFAIARIRRGPRTGAEIGRMLVTSVLIPPAASWHRLRGQLRYRHASGPPLALLFDRDDTLIEDVPYLADPEKVRPMPGAETMLPRLRAAGVRLGIISNQSGVAKDLISPEELAAVNSRVEALLGPFDTWQVCIHDRGDGCSCRKPGPGLIRQAAHALGVATDRCVIIGDTEADVLAAEGAGARGILVPTAKTRPEEVQRAQLVARDLTEAVRLAMGVTR
ncbi:HAD-IIIA family hydrolase [Amycolatopsis taiwanensis]|uniref:HAD-IIIA family hydrolase n=1 Tax=Amycolatopsis taiwanensis TaxID=342230 RepID=UPI000486EBA2|nr:HAD-IIIA family hydrolase [Amycolatopsis taiwanensis]